VLRNQKCMIGNVDILVRKISDLVVDNNQGVLEMIHDVGKER